jgi:hypothetical protein
MKILPQHLLGGTEAIHKKPSRYPRQNLNKAPPEHYTNLLSILLFINSFQRKIHYHNFAEIPVEISVAIG